MPAPAIVTASDAIVLTVTIPAGGLLVALGIWLRFRRKDR